MATATIVFSAPAPVVSGHNEFTTSFIPPSNVSGRSCYLKVCNIAALNATSVHLEPYTTYMLTMDFSQPFSYGSINDSVGSVIASDGRIKEKQCRNIVVGLFQTVKEGTVFQSVYPRILVEIPDGPQYIKVGLWRTDAACADDLDQISVLFELTPIDTVEDIHVSI